MPSNKKKDTDQFKKEVFDIVGDEFSVESEYINTHTPVLMKHKGCGKTISVLPTHFLGGTRCRHCSYKELGRSRRKKTENVRKEISDLTDESYELLSEYHKSNTKLKIKHLDCGNIFEMKYRFFVNMGQRCPKCRLSKGEEKIKKWLESKKMNYREQFRFEDCRDIRPLPFDFAVFKGEKTLLIEYDGQQHFEERFNFSGRKEKDSLENISRRDSIKDQFCKKNKLKLLRISFKDFNKIDKILEEFIQ